eukprot:NODE_850_length_1296_cov_301.854852_g624_i0.p1 GENE.NODE_850_length_1296_cov_301.854852_g624_i0~~NODE_850_length_1296_cov_301.854852_g624_i0.p1  ORF type:complete len:365 (+),score=102.55 NODE_850_length_1296_cov_301.854852_g624_i0:60-1097(+)
MFLCPCANRVGGSNLKRVEDEDWRPSEKDMMSLARTNQHMIIFVEPTHYVSTKHKDNIDITTPNMDPEESQRRGLAEHRAIQKLLSANGIAYKVFKQPLTKAADSVFVSDSYFALKNEYFPDGVLFQMPMFHKDRQLEKNAPLVKFCMETLKYKNFVDLSFYEKHNLALEGKGVLVIDWKDRTVYCGRSQRAHDTVLNDFCNHMSVLSGYQFSPYMIDAIDAKRNALPYHTTAWLRIFSRVCTVDYSGFHNPKQMNEVMDRISRNWPVVSVNYDEMHNGATLGVECHRADGSNALLLETAAWDSMKRKTVKAYRNYFTDFLVTDISVMESVGGAAMACMAQPCGV